ncbi:MAG: polyamine aminopropyltransferase [Sulfolobales archaeon]|nr:polyamine aminopropyltransferase [Sulfolobales archaeon]MCX8186743.1 polyamine aminopropyltransferase [Sulfolobales archaeon]MDW7969684.1 polyamine aminopropyltransferase [Sulfolobales archaeon]
MFSSMIAIEPVSRTVNLIAGLRAVLVNTKTKYQSVHIVELEEFGKALILDGLIQSTQADEFLYHESLVHPALLTHPNPKKVLIIGGGEGAALREVLKHPTVNRAVMVDIDGELVELAKKYLEVMHRGSFNDPRSEVIIMDGFKYVDESKEVFDVAILDLTDPHGPEIARALYSKDFYLKLARRLSHDGVLVSQVGSSFFFPNTYQNTLNSVREVFNVVREYSIWIPSFGYACNFIVASNVHDPAKLSASNIDNLLRERNVSTKFYCGKVHTAFMNLPVVLNDFSRDFDK